MRKRALIAHLSKSADRKLEDVLLNSATGEIQRGKKILITGRDVESLQGLATRLKDGDHVAFFPACRQRIEPATSGVRRVGMQSTVPS